MSNDASLQRLWREAGFNPNANQQAAILHGIGPLHLPAGPGSGKTRVLLWRALNLIVFHQIRPEEIFLSTFTEKAALQLREGLRTLLGLASNCTGMEYDISRMYVGTVHSLCQLLLTDRRFSSDGSRPKTPLLMDELSQYFHFYKRKQWEELAAASGINGDAISIVNAAFGDNSQSRHKAVTNCIAFFNRLSEECIDTAQARVQTNDPGLHRLLDLYEAYQQSLNPDAKLERTAFSLLQQQALAVLDRVPSSGNVFKHIIIDEYQDTNTVQERLFFRLAAGHKNLCVVGDDDQALYRFRGATVENFVEFPDRCRRYLKTRPTRIALSTNYRSRRIIVDFYVNFIDRCDWTKPGPKKGFYRVADKDIHAHRKDAHASVVLSTPGAPEDVCAEIAGLVRRLLDEKKVNDPNQIAFLYPSLKSPQVVRMMDALGQLGLKVYAPRANRFLEVDEAVDVVGVFLHVFGQPEQGDLHGSDYDMFHGWLNQANARADGLIHADSDLARFVRERRMEIEEAVKDHSVLEGAIEQHGWHAGYSYAAGKMRDALLSAPGLSKRARCSLANPVMNRTSAGSPSQGSKLGYVINRATSLDWTVLDLLYRLCKFKHFKAMLDLAERGQDEGPICNLALLSQYLSRFMDEYRAVLTGQFLSGGSFGQTFFSSYLYAIYRRGESEYEDAEDPFPRGRIPFITIHQAKGLEFPVVVLGNPRKKANKPQMVERMVHPFLSRQGEPLERMTEFDMMRLFYVALSRPQNLLIIPRFTGRGQGMSKPFETMLNGGWPSIPQLDLATVPAAAPNKEALPKNYSYTSDYLLYQRCPRQYMMFRKYGFVPSRSQTMFFGRLVHQTIEDLHQLLITRRTRPQ